MSDLIAINGGAFNLAIQALKRSGKDEIAEQLEADCECVPDLIERLQRERDKLAVAVELLRFISDTEYADEDERIADIHGVLEATPQDNLNAIKRGIARNAYKQGVINWCIDDEADIEEMENRGLLDNINKDSDEYANTKYPTTEGE